MRVLIADDQLLVLNGVRGALESAGDIHVVAATQRGNEIVALKVVALSAAEDAAQIAQALGRRRRRLHRQAHQPRRPAVRPAPARGRVIYHSGPACSAAPARAAEDDLTQRELMMLEAISRGPSTKAISRELRISEKTVKFHLTNIYRKLGVPNRAAAMRYARDHDLIEEPQLPQLARAASA